MHTRTLLILLFSLLAALGSACLKKASGLPNGHGGYTLVTTVKTVDQAATRFRRKAEDLCGSIYTMGEPSVLVQGWSNDVSMRVDVRCGAAQNTAAADIR